MRKKAKEVRRRSSKRAPRPVAKNDLTARLIKRVVALGGNPVAALISEEAGERTRSRSGSAPVPFAVTEGGATHIAVK